MKAEDIKIGMKVKLVKYTYDDGSAKWKEEIDCGEVRSFDRYNKEWCGKQGVRVDIEGLSQFVSADMIEPLAQSMNESPLIPSKINVQKYADDNGISLAQAHIEIQSWLFERGIYWKPLGNEAIKLLHTSSQVLTFDEENVLFWDINVERIGRPELVFERTLMLKPVYVEEKEETVEYNGKRYNKKAFEAAIEQLCIEEEE